MADVVNDSAAPAAVPSKHEEQALVVARRRAEEKVPRHKFGLAYLLLAAVLGAAVGLAVVFATRDDHKSTPIGARWSKWRPATTGTRGVREIAAYVSPHYHLENGAQLVGVAAGPMLVPTEQGQIPVSAILVGSGTAGVIQQRIEVAQPQAGVFYQMCGGGPRCAIKGESTLLRGQLLFREALELGLYTFRYLPEADNIVVFLPPPTGVTSTSPYFQRALYLPRAALASRLSVPLESALPPGTTAMSPTKIPKGEGLAINGMIEGRVFHYEYQPAPDQGVFLTLSPLP
jgi:hypothetical protein